MSAKFQDLEKILDPYPHLKSRLQLYWGTKKCRDFLKNLLLIDGKRQGFPFEVLMTIDRLIELHDKDYPQFKPKKDLWDSSNTVMGGLY